MIIDTFDQPLKFVNPGFGSIDETVLVNGPFGELLDNHAITGLQMFTEQEFPLATLSTPITAAQFAGVRQTVTPANDWTVERVTIVGRRSIAGAAGQDTCLSMTTAGTPAFKIAGGATDTRIFNNPSGCQKGVGW